MATDLTDNQKFYKILQFQSKLSCLMQTEIWIIYTYSGKSTSYKQNQKNKNNNII